ncbi:MAG: hypothetical protein AAB778_01235 [Patescibacteria group bacterium]
MLDRNTLNTINDNAGLTAIPGSPVLLLNAVIPYIYGVVGIVLLFNLISAGFKLMISQGEPKGIQEAQLKLKNSAIGFIILFTSYWIVKLVMQFLGIDVQLFM